MFDSSFPTLPSFPVQNNPQNSISGLSSGAFMTVQLHIAHSARFIGAGVIAGGPYRAAQTFRAAPTVPLSCILNSLYIAMTPLTQSSAPDVSRLLQMARSTPDIDDLAHVAGQRMYIFTGTRDVVVNQYAVNSTRAFYEALGVTSETMMFIDDVPAGHSIITMNPEDSPLGSNQPPFINQGDFYQSHQLLDHIYGGSGPLKAPAQKPLGELIRFEQAEFVGYAQDRACMAEFGYAYIPSAVANGTPARGTHIALHGCKQGYAYVDFVFGREDTQNQPPYGQRYIKTTGYMEWAEANNLIVLFPQADGGDSNAVQNPDGCWDWWGYSAADLHDPDYFTQNAVQIKAINAMLDRIGVPATATAGAK